VVVALVVAVAAVLEQLGCLAVLLAQQETAALVLHLLSTVLLLLMQAAGVEAASM
jgi:hypothetical protein